MQGHTFGIFGAREPLESRFWSNFGDFSPDFGEKSLKFGEKSRLSLTFLTKSIDFEPDLRRQGSVLADFCRQGSVFCLNSLLARVWFWKPQRHTQSKIFGEQWSYCNLAQSHRSRYVILKIRDISLSTVKSLISEPGAIARKRGRLLCFSDARTKYSLRGCFSHIFGRETLRGALIREGRLIRDNMVYQ